MAKHIDLGCMAAQLVVSDDDYDDYCIEGVPLDAPEDNGQTMEQLHATVFDESPFSSISGKDEGKGEVKMPFVVRAKWILSTIQERLAFILLLLLSMAQTVTSRLMSGGGLASHGTLHRGLGFVWKSFGSLKNAVKTTASLKNLKLLKYSLAKGGELNIQIRNALARDNNKDLFSASDFAEILRMNFEKKIEKKRKPLPGEFETIKGFYCGLDEVQKTSESEVESTTSVLNPQPARSYVMELLDDHWERAAHDESAELDNLWCLFQSPDVTQTSPSTNTFLSSNFEFPATEAVTQLVKKSSSSSGDMRSVLDLKSNPDATKGLLNVLEKAHWWCNNPFARYTLGNGAHVHVVGNDLIVGFRGSSTLLDIFSDLQIGSAVGPHGARVHKGFLRALETVNKDNGLIRDISSIIDKHGIKRIVLAGYSLGGAVASLFLLKYGEDFKKRGIDMFCVTFGCPRFIHNEDIAKLPRSLTTRIIHSFAEGDPVPMSLTSYLPWAPRYNHVGHSVVLPTSGSSVICHNEKDSGVSEPINWLNPFGFHHHLQENYQRAISFAQLQMKLADILHRIPFTKKICSVLRQHQNDEDFFEKVLNENKDFPVMSNAFSAS